MSSTRTQIYLTTEQRARIDELASLQGISLAEVVRRALDAYLSDVSPDTEETLRSTFGADATIRVPDRGEWSRG